MLEIIVIVLAVVAIVKIASADDQSPILWGGITIALSVLCCMFIPLPLIRIGIAFALSFVGMIGYKIIANR